MGRVKRVRSSSIWTSSPSVALTGVLARGACEVLAFVLICYIGEVARYMIQATETDACLAEIVVST